MMNDEQIKALLEDTRTIAVVGASTNPEKAAHRIPRLLIKLGFTVIPVNPGAEEILGQKVYPTLADIPDKVDIVDVFRPPAAAPEIARQAVDIGASVLWLQLGITSEEAAQIATDSGLTYVEDLCLGETAKRLLGEKA